MKCIDILSAANATLKMDIIYGTFTVVEYICWILIVQLCNPRLYLLGAICATLCNSNRDRFPCNWQ